MGLILSFVDRQRGSCGLYAAAAGQQNTQITPRSCTRDERVLDVMKCYLQILLVGEARTIESHKKPQLHLGSAQTSEFCDTGS